MPMRCLEKERALPLELLKSLLHYDPETGIFTRLKARGNHGAGKQVGHISNGDARIVSINGRSYLLHRLAWFYTHGVWPADEIDHINRQPADNRLINLREATRHENMQNQSVRVTNKHGYPGIKRNIANSDKWLAYIRRTYIGSFATKEEAIQARKLKEAELYPFKPQEAKP